MGGPHTQLRSTCKSNNNTHVHLGKKFLNIPETWAVPFSSAVDYGFGKFTHMKDIGGAPRGKLSLHHQIQAAGMPVTRTHQTPRGVPQGRASRAPGRTLFPTPHCQRSQAGQMPRSRHLRLRPVRAEGLLALQNHHDALALYFTGSGIHHVTLVPVIHARTGKMPVFRYLFGV